MPLLASFHPKIQFYKKWKSFFSVNLLVAIFFIVWDEIFTQQGIWGFNKTYLTGFYVGQLPIEELLFFVCIPYACTFTYHCLIILLPDFKLTASFSKIQTILLAAILLSFTIWNVELSYTFYTGAFTTLFLLFCLTFKIEMSGIYIAYLLIIPFFLISNGYLTGSFTNEPIVWYNNAENLSLRTFTIPVEDYVYGFLLVAGNIVFTYWKDLRK